MKILHRYAFNVTSEIRQKLSSIGIEIDIPDEEIEVLYVDESDKNLQFIEATLKASDITPFIETEFTKNEILQANACNIYSNWHNGYPEPSDDFGYLEETFDLKDYCEECGCGLKQKAPFLIKGEPKWGRRSMFSLNWEYSNFFVKPGIWDFLFKPFGIDCLPVLHYKKRTKLSSVVQLLLPEPTVIVDVSELEVSKCESCGRSKAEAAGNKGGYFPKIIEGELNVVAKTKNYFGSGGSAWHEIIIGAELVKKIHASGIKGIEFAPLS